MNLPFVVKSSETGDDVAAFMLATYVHMVADTTLLDPSDTVEAWGKVIGRLADVGKMDFEKFLRVTGQAREAYYASVDRLK